MLWQDQAEDGIRDTSVTGVQTCALPILVDDWFRLQMDNRMAEILLDSDSRMYQYLSQRAVQKLFREHSARHNNNHKILFSLIVFEEWLKIGRASCRERV